MSLSQRLIPYIQLMRLNRPIGFLLLLWPTLGALWIASSGQPSWLNVLIFSLGVVIMRSAGCAINDFADRKIDGQVWRTQQRPLATGALTAKQAVMTFVVMSLLALGLVLLLNPLTMALSVVALLLAASYPFMKRYTHLPQVVLGMAFGWAIPMAFSAETNTLPMMAWWLFIANIAWTVMYDTFYAMADRDDDLLAGVKSTAILFGRYDLMIQASLQAVYLVIMIIVGVQLAFGWVFYLGLVVATGLFIYQLLLARQREPKACLHAFLNNNWVGLAVFVAIVLEYAFAQ